MAILGLLRVVNADPWISLDGRSSAPSATIQYPTLLNNYPSASPPSARTRWPSNGTQPPWMVAGVDYAVGVPTGTSLLDWQSISQSGVSVNTGTGQITISGANVTLNAIDFTLHGGCFISNTTNNSSLTITNSSFGALTVGQSYNIHVQTTNSNLTVSNCIFNGGNNASAAYIGFQASGTVDLRYNLFENGDSHVIEQVSGTITLVYKYNLVVNMAQVAGAHDNWLQFGTIGAGSTADVEFNTCYTNFLNTGVVAGEGFQFYANNTGSLTTATLAYNTMIAVQYLSAATMSSIIHGGTASTGSNHDNYFDASGCGSSLPNGAYYPGSMVAGDGWTASANIDMRTGSTITPV